MQNWAEWFYNSRAWRDCRDAYMRRAHFVCEICGGSAEIVHHVAPIQPSNVNDTRVTLNMKNLQALCRACHADSHGAMWRRRYAVGDDGEIRPPCAGGGGAACHRRGVSSRTPQ